MRVIQWATGSVGRAAVGTIVGREPIGVLATCDVDEILALEAEP